MWSESKELFYLGRIAAQLESGAAQAAEEEGSGWIAKPCMGIGHLLSDAVKLGAGDGFVAEATKLALHILASRISGGEKWEDLGRYCGANGLDAQAASEWFMDKLMAPWDKRIGPWRSADGEGLLSMAFVLGRGLGWDSGCLSMAEDAQGAFGRSTVWKPVPGLAGELSAYLAGLPKAGRARAAHIVRSSRYCALDRAQNPLLWALSSTDLESFLESVEVAEAAAQANAPRRPAKL